MVHTPGRFNGDHGYPRIPLSELSNGTGRETKTTRDGEEGVTEEVSRIRAQTFRAMPALCSKSRPGYHRDIVYAVHGTTEITYKWAKISFAEVRSTPHARFQPPSS